MASISGPEIHWSVIPVKSAIQGEVGAAREGVANGDELVATLTSVGALLKAAGRNDEFTAVREAAQRMLQARHNLQVHQVALTQLQHSYVPSGEATDFAAELAQAADAVESAQPYSVDSDELMVEFDSQAGQAAGEAADEQIDDEIAIAGESTRQVARNITCPITMRAVMDLQEPVEDKMAFVYERWAIEEMLNKKGGGPIPCPVAGTTHTVCLADLKPARALLAEKRRGGGRKKRAAEDDADLVELD